MDEVETTVLRCSACGRIAERLHTSQWDLRSLSLGVDVKVADLLCDRCWLKIQQELTQEEALRGPA